MDSAEIHNVLTAKAKLDAEIRRLTDAFDDEYAGKLDQVIERFEQQTNDEFYVRDVHNEIFVRSPGEGIFDVHINNGGSWGDNDCSFEMKIVNGILTSAVDVYRDFHYRIKEATDD